MMRPRILFFAVFVFFSLSGGRFTATFLEHELQLSEWMISAAFSLQLLSSSLCKPWLGGLADSLEASGGKSNGRMRVMSLGLTVSTIATLMHSLGGLHYWSTNTVGNDVDPETDDSQTTNINIPLLVYHLILRAIFSIGTAAVMPALDGLTLVQLEREGVDKQNYGKERMYGAISCASINPLVVSTASQPITT